ncbi:hypothetical protein ACFQY5_03990 [Paeniroseomonas aquatica]|uniref:hypothetical protein n=1 Tax=Paeniroseomonas aquatica TaxID=373043 RepID=UPI0036174EBB
MLDRLTRGLAARDILLLHDGTPGTRPRGEAAVLAVLPPLLARCAAAGLRVGSLAPVAARASPAAAAGR